VQTDPGRLATVGAASEILFFRVTGANSGSLYGTGVYTSDSSLATAAVHAGVLKLGHTGIVKVTTIPSHPQYLASTQNGITSSSWSSYPGFRVEALDDEDLDLAECEPPSAAVPTITDGTPPALPPAICAPPKPAPAGQDPAGPTSQPAVVVWPTGLPAEAREQLEGHLAAAAELRQATREKVARLAADSVNRLKPIQDAHTRAARLDEAIGVRDLIRQLTP
jgi:LCCL domain